MLIIGAVSSCSFPAAPAARSLDLPGGKVLVVGIPGLTWEDIVRTRPPAMTSLASRGAIGNVSIRASNRLGEGYATLGAGNRTVTAGSSGWAFNEDEVVHSGRAAALFEAQSGEVASGRVVVVPIGDIKEHSFGDGFSPVPGLIGESLGAQGGSAAVIGNADLSLGALPEALPPITMSPFSAGSDPGIHREAALLAMDASGQVAQGDVGRELLTSDPQAPFGIATSLDASLEAFLRVWPESDLVVVETGDTYRADLAGIELPEDQARALRSSGLLRADRQIGGLLDAVDLDSTLVMIVAPVTPGGPNVRGQLRPVILAGAGVEHGMATSTATRRIGLVTAFDLSATIAGQLGLSDGRFASGRRVEVAPADDMSSLVEMNSRAVLHDKLRGPISGITLGLQLVIYAIAIWKMSSGSLPGWGIALLAASMAFPVATFVSRTPIWKSGFLAATLSVIVASLALGGLASLLERRRRFLGVTLLLAVVWGFFVLDVIFGAPGQQDSILGSSSVVGGRFFGLGNLGFALFAGSAILLGGMLVETLPRGGRTAALAVLFLTVVVIGHPALGGDVGGTLAMVPTVSVFVFLAVGGTRFRLKYLPLIGMGAVALVLLFGAIDLARPAVNRTHLGDFLATALEDPASIFSVLLRKITLAVGVLNAWVALAAGAVAVLIFLHRRSGLRWGAIVADRPGLRAALDSACVAAVVGSIVNDSGLAVAGMLLALAAPWALLVTAGLNPRADPI